jgi:hypothetical protein
VLEVVVFQAVEAVEVEVLVDIVKTIQAQQLQDYQ